MLLCFLLEFYTGVHAHPGLSQFGEVSTHSSATFRLSSFETEHGRVLHGIDLAGRV